MSYVDALINNFDSAESAANYYCNVSFAFVFKLSDFNNSLFCNVVGDDASFKLVDIYDVYDFLYKLDIGKSTGADDVPNVIYKSAAMFLAELLTNIVNTCLL